MSTVAVNGKNIAGWRVTEISAAEFACDVDGVS